MSLIKCTECGKEISEKATACPNCGNPINTPSPVLVRTDYKAKAKAFITAGIIVFIISGVVGFSTVDYMLGLKAKYVLYGTGPYKILNFLLEAVTWSGIILIGIGIIYLIISKTTSDHKNNKPQNNPWQNNKW